MTMARLTVFTVLALTGGGLAKAGDPQPDRKSSSPIEPLAIAPRLVDQFGDPLPAGALLRLGTTRLRHADVCAFAFTADKKLVSFGRDYVVRIWDPDSGQQLSERAFEKDKIHRFSAGFLSADASRVAIQLGEQLKVFEVASGRELAAVRLSDQFEARAKFSPDGSRLVVAEQEGKVQICDVSKNTCQPLRKVSGPPRDFAFSRDGQKLALADLNSGTVVWDLAKSRELIRFKPTGSSALTVDFDGTGDVLAVLGSTNPPQPFQFVKLSIGQSPDGWTAPTVGDVHWVRFAPDGSTVVLGRKDRIEWFDPKVGKAIRTATGPSAVRRAERHPGVGRGVREVGCARERDRCAGG
jgi:WD40 repeat protein